MGSLKFPPTVREVSAALKNRYRDFNHYKLKDPLDELLFINCSTKTGEASYRSTYRSLKETYPTHLQIAEAPAEYIAQPIVSGDLSNQKSMAIRKLLDVNVERFGEPSGDFYLVFDVEQATEFDGFGWDYSKLPNQPGGRQSATPFVVTLDLVLAAAQS